MNFKFCQAAVYCFKINYFPVKTSKKQPFLWQEIISLTVYFYYISLILQLFAHNPEAYLT